LFWVQIELAYFFSCALSKVPLLDTEKNINHVHQPSYYLHEKWEVADYCSPFSVGGRAEWGYDMFKEAED
jgi:hypothetical protein